MHSKKENMQKLSWNPAALMAPIPPVLVSCGTMEQPNVFTVGWTGIINTRPPRTYISVRPERFSYELICKSGEFVLNLPSADLVRAVDYCGVRSGRKQNKFQEMGLTPEPAQLVSAPMVAQCPISIECRVLERQPQGSHDLFLAEIVRVHVGEQFVNPKTGALDIAACNLLAYAHGGYFTLGKQVGSFGFSVQKKKSRKNGKVYQKNTAKKNLK